MKLALRTCNQDGTSYGGFQWPLEVGAKVSAPDWDPNPKCGGGLHGLLWGTGEVTLLDHTEDKVWMVVEVNEYVDLDGKIKFPECVIKYVGERDGAVAMIQKEAPPECLVHFANKTVGNKEVVNVGDWGVASAGDDGTATAEYGGTAIAGVAGTATAGYEGKATAGEYGTASAGYCGVATAGRLGTATAGGGGEASAGKCGTISIWHYREGRPRLLVGYIGEDGLEPNTPYRVEDGKFVEVT